MARLTGTWTKPGQPYPSSHLIATADVHDDDFYKTRCGRLLFATEPGTPEPPANAKTCERCAILSRRDG